MQKETLLTTNTHFETKWEKLLSARTLKFIRMLKIESRDEQHCNLGKSKLKPLMISVASSCSFQYFLFLETLLFPVHYVTAFVWFFFSFPITGLLCFADSFFPPHFPKWAVPWGSIFSFLLPLQAFLWLFYLFITLNALKWMHSNSATVPSTWCGSLDDSKYYSPSDIFSTTTVTTTAAVVK